MLEKLYEPYTSCTACPLGDLGRSQVVFGDGNPNAQLMFIGEGPGREEDILGKPFVGRSGKLLDKIMEVAGLSRGQVFIANVVKCRPPNNRKPLPTESKTCKKLLLFKQIKIIRPQLICTLGSSALEALIEQEVRITKIRGKIIEHNDVKILPTYHPAYILRNRRELEKFASDIQMAARLSRPRKKQP
ncbi:uracil-DNA glycosylase [Candidatus Dependentiae bacterium]